MKFKVGDYVKIKEGLNRRNTNDFVEEMEKYCGKVAKITKVNSICSIYLLNIDENEWWWNEYMVEPLQGKTYNVTVEKLKWKPDYNEHYWTIDFSYPGYVRNYIWENNSIDNKFFKNGLVFKTAIEAIKAAEKMLRII